MVTKEAGKERGVRGEDPCSQKCWRKSGTNRTPGKRKRPFFRRGDSYPDSERRDSGTAKAGNCRHRYGKPGQYDRGSTESLYGSGSFNRGRSYAGTDSEPGKPVFVSYKPQEIYEYVMNHPEYEKIALLQSGDLGFYSGAKKLMEIFAGEEMEVYPGISSVVYLCDRLHMSWEDVVLVSQHGRYANLIGKIRKNKKVFALLGKGSMVNELCQKLTEYKMDQVVLHVGQDLSYPTEQIRTGFASELRTQSFADLCVVLLENPNPDTVITHGMEDEAFLRAKVPGDQK